MSHVLGIDLGGTKVLAGVVDTSTGEVLASAKKRTHAEHTSVDIVDRLIEAAKRAIEDSGIPRHSIEAAGIGAAGQIDRQRGLIVNAPNLGKMSNMPLAEKVKRELKVQVHLFNDVEAAAAGEATFGAGTGHADFVVIFVGTGVGGALYRKGKPYTGATETAGEIGHIVVDHDGRLCSCGGAGHLEAYASRTAIVKYMLSAMHLGRQSVLLAHLDEINPNDPGGSGIRSRAIADALAQDDKLVKESIGSGAEYLAAGLSSVINFYNPPIIILGGGLVQAVDIFFQHAARRAKEMALQVPSEHVKIVKAALGDNSGIVGAAVLADRSIQR